MKAIVYDHYGKASPLRLAEIPEPEVRSGEVVVRVTKAALNPKDIVVRRGKFRAVTGNRFPKQCGLDLAGVVVRSRSSRFAAGQRVFGCLDEWTFRRGTLAERVTCRDTEIAFLPDGVPDEAGAGIALAGLTALQALRDDAKLGASQRVLINGASGGVGTAALQIARLLGAEVHSVSSEANRALCTSLGAQHTWTYPEHDWQAAPAFDVIFDVFGNLTFAAARAHLTPRGRFVSTVPTLARMVRNWTSRVSAQQERLVIIKSHREDLDVLARWLAQGALRTVIDSRFSIVSLAAAFSRLESKRARGKIIVEVAIGAAFDSVPLRVRAGRDDAGALPD
jgi:NADPH:quinone reductase-like Zn-dependent oxidoreductase